MPTTAAARLRLRRRLLLRHRRRRRRRRLCARCRPCASQRVRWWGLCCCRRREGLRAAGTVAALARGADGGDGGAPPLLRSATQRGAHREAHHALHGRRHRGGAAQPDARRCVLAAAVGACPLPGPAPRHAARLADAAADLSHLGAHLRRPAPLEALSEQALRPSARVPARRGEDGGPARLRLCRAVARGLDRVARAGAALAGDLLLLALLPHLYHVPPHAHGLPAARGRPRRRHPCLLHPRLGRAPLGQPRRPSWRRSGPPPFSPSSSRSRRARRRAGAH
ncbi:hypothetical protein EMIHUDRAFT_466599, partial [Emiliania huxleyi CCMP1516]|uniref:Uncharacterized protein n=2 Tax=Emiliania huxleyi TaxID=2903 RepID=A0A0D3KVY8_EMIH1